MNKESRSDEFPLLRSRKFWAERLGVCEATLARAAERSDLAFVRVGDRVLHSPQQISDWLARRERKARA
jgi:hypothetical protein